MGDHVSDFSDDITFLDADMF